MNDRLLKRGLSLEYLTLGWNIVGTFLVILAALASGSVSLAGFGIDSLIEIFASVIVVWQLKGIGDQRERQALRFIGTAFFALAIYILFQSGHTLLTQAHSEISPLILVWLAATLIVMLVLAWGKYQTGTRLNNPVLLTEGRVTLVDAYLAAAVLIGLILDLFFGWWWADPLAGLVIVYYGLHEGFHAWHEAAEMKPI